MSPQTQGHVTIRMHNVAFGDMFLVQFPAPDGRRRKVLIDCGCHQASIDPPPLREVVARLIQDVTDPDGVPRLDVVVATHRHMDHVSGFADKAWAKVEVREVWMPWTEDPASQPAKEIRELQSMAARKTIAAAQGQRRFRLTAQQREELERAMVMASNNLVNQKAMATLHAGFSKSPAFALRRYLPEREGGETFETDVLPKVKVHVLAPSHSLKVMTARDDEDELYQLSRELARSPAGAGLPFRSEWRLTPRQFDRDYRHLKLDAKTRAALSHALETDAFAAAATLEYSVNNTSLMLVFEIGRGCLLFSGDAQWSTWNMVLDSGWRELLAKTTFYKVGHHGSHNATPIQFVEKVLGAKFWALASTGPTVKWTDIIPRPALLKQLREKSDRVVRSDQQDVPDPQLPGFRRAAKNAYVEVDLKV